MPSEARTQDMPTTISVSEELADDLYARKGRGESYEDVIQRLIEKADRCEELEERIAESDSSGSWSDTEIDESVAEVKQEMDTDFEESAEIEEDDRTNTEAIEDREELEGPELEALIGDIVADGVLPGSGAKLEKRREALRATVEYLREHRKAEPKDFKRDVYPDYPAEYTDGQDPPNSWWKNCIYKGMRELAERSEEVEKPDQTGEWMYTGENDE